jgi:glycerol-3-phosphate dehydrogenase (NAD(P)+)
MRTVTILGAGVMGSSMCMPLVHRGFDVRLVGTHLDEHIISSVKGNGLHPKLNVTMPESVKAFSHGDFGKALDGDTDLILLGVSSAGVAWAIDRLCEVMKKPVPVIMITKGMKPEAAGMRVFPDVVAEELKQRLGFDVPVAAIGGPCIAGELAARRHTGTVIVSRDAALAQSLTDALSGDYYFPRASTDMIGVEVCAAFKNFFAIAVGWAHGQMEVLEETQNKAKNNNPAAILFDQAVRELMALTLAMGGGAESVWGMPGVGDLYVTCQAGRNSRLGNALGRGLTYAGAKDGPLKGETVEGAELGVAVASSIRGMITSGRLSAEHVPLTLALLDALTNNTPLVPPWPKFHGSAK